MSDNHKQSRRAFFRDAAALGATAALGAAALSSVPAAHAQEYKKTYVLVHGGWRGGWAWRPLVDILEAKGHKVYAPSLTGLGDRSHLLNKDIRLKTHVMDIVNIVKYERLENIVLVGHSAAGFVITEVANEIPDKIETIVYLDAFLPNAGESANNTASERAQASQNEAKAKGEISMPAFPAKAFGGKEENWEWIDSLSVPHPLMTLMDPVSSTEGRDSIGNRIYIRSTGFNLPAFNKAYEQTKDDPAWKSFIMECGHDISIDCPDELADILFANV